MQTIVEIFKEKYPLVMEEITNEIREMMKDLPPDVKNTFSAEDAVALSFVHPRNVMDFFDKKGIYIKIGRRDDAFDFVVDTEFGDGFSERLEAETEALNAAFSILEKQKSKS